MIPWWEVQFLPAPPGGPRLASCRTKSNVPRWPRIGHGLEKAWMLTEDRCLLGGVDHEREHRRQLVFHLGLAKENGATEEELIEAITQLAFYAGWPKAMSAMAVAKQVFRGGTD